MNLKKYLGIAFLLGMLFIMGCGGEGDTGVATEGYYGCYNSDNSMIDAYFDEYAPLSSDTNTYQPGEEIDVNVILVNKMPDDLDENIVKVRLKGDAAIESIFTGAQIVNNPALYSVDTETCLTTEEEAVVGPIIYQPELSTKISKEIAALYCYEKPVEVHGYLFFTEEETEIGMNLPTGANPPSGVRVTLIEQNPVDVDRDSNTASLRFKIYIQNTGTGTVIESLDECFEYREMGYREELTLAVEGAYAQTECSQDVRLSRESREDVITCTVEGIDPSNLGPQASELIITLSDFAYEDEIASTTIWLEP